MITIIAIATIVCIALLVIANTVRNTMIILKEKELRIQEFKYNMTVIYDRWYQDKKSVDFEKLVESEHIPQELKDINEPPEESINVH